MAYPYTNPFDFGSLSNPMPPRIPLMQQQQPAPRPIGPVVPTQEQLNAVSGVLPAGLLPWWLNPSKGALSYPSLQQQKPIPNVSSNLGLGGNV